MLPCLPLLDQSLYVPQVHNFLHVHYCPFLFTAIDNLHLSFINSRVFLHVINALLKRERFLLRKRLIYFQHDLKVHSVSAGASDVQVTIACDAVLNAPSAYKKQEPESWEEEIQVSRHARSLRQLDNGVRIPPR